MYIQDTARIKAAMVIYALEQDLGEYVRSEHTDINMDGTAFEVAARIQKNSPNAAAPTTHQIVEATFLSEILSLAATASLKSSDEEYFIRLRRIFEYLEITEIRNSVSHPNRPFLESYWHRTCALATDPVIDKLRFTRVIQQYRLACEEKLSAPPDEWMELRRSYIRNNLPENVEYELTGLIGRDRDLVKLENELKGGRNSLIAIVARGGTGKTALALECLNMIALKPETADWAEAIIFCTLKQERLTSLGIQKIESPNSPETLKNELLISLNFVLLDDCADFETMVIKHQNDKLLIVIDNLETLLRDRPEKFGDLVDELPLCWKVLVTSRIPVEAAKNIPLNSLTRPSSIFLIRKYFLSRGYSNIDADILERVGGASNDNPLAIRLIADLFIAGKDMGSAISIAANEITSYSFSNLIEALSNDSILLLEGLFALESANRSILVEVLEISLDRVASAIAQLGKTSLISRATNESLEEIYSIDGSIRDLLRVAPKNLDIRRQVNSKIGRLRAIEQDVIQQQKTLARTPLDRDFVPEDTPVALISIIDMLNRALSGKNTLIVKELDSKLRSIEDLYLRTSIFFKQLVRIAYFFGDKVAEENALLRMLEVSPQDPYALLSLGYLYRSEQRLPEAYAQFKALIDAGWGQSDKSGQIAAISIHQGYVSTLIFMEKCNEVLRLTEDWRSRGYLRLVYGIARVSAFRHQCEVNMIANTVEARISMNSAVSVLTTLMALEGSPLPIIKEQIKIITHIPSILNLIQNNAQDRQSALRLLAYCHEQIPLLQSQPNSPSDIINSKLREIDIPGNPFRENGIISHNRVEIATTAEDRLPDGFKLVEIYHIPSSSSFPTYMFARDEDNKAYFLLAERFQKGDWANWILLSTGSKVAVQAVPSKTGSTDYRATKILSI